MKRKLYNEGDWFGVPVTFGYVLGCIARIGSRGGILLGYFYSPLRQGIPTIEDTMHLNPSGAFYIRQFCDSGLIDGSWPILGHNNQWDRENWPMPSFGRVSDFAENWGILARYDENDPAISLTEIRVTSEKAMQFPQDGLSGHRALQYNLETYFKEGPLIHDPSERGSVPVWYRGLPDPNIP